MNIQHNEKLRDRLSAAYVLGTLKGGARRRFEAMLHSSALMQREVAEWQDRLHPLAEFSTAVTPPSRVWQAIDQQLGLRKLSGKTSPWAFWLELRDDLSFWRGLGLVSTTAATILVAVLAIKQPETAAPAAPAASYVAMLSDDKSQTAMVITGDASHHQLVARVLTHQTLAKDKSLELWAVPKSGAPRSLGLVAADGTITLPLPDNATPQSIPLLAVSLEPKGGSPDPNGPTGPIVLKGAWVQI
jgi:anti-sigma-K factor RskA